MTGSRGPVSKPAHLRQRRNKPTSLVVVREGFGQPAPQKVWLAQTKAAWSTYWASELSAAIREAQLPMVVRLFALRDERERSYRVVVSGKRLVPGSKGQPVLNPLIDYVARCDGEIRQLEDRLGLSPRSMVALGQSFAKAAKSLDDLNRSVAEVDEDEDDPRRIQVV